MLLDRTKRLAAAAGEAIWPGYDVLRYIAWRPAATDNEAAFTWSSNPEKNDPDDLMNAGDSYLKTRSAALNLDLVFHEAFHCYQHDPNRPGSPWRGELPRMQFRYGAMPARDFAGYCLEALFLDQALSATEVSARRTAARRFLALRRERQKGMAAENGEFEKGAELNEGLAQYAGVKAVMLGIEAQRQGRLDLSVEEKTAESWRSKRLEFLPKMKELQAQTRRRFYTSGAAQAFLLDELAPDWKTRVQNQTIALQDLIGEAIGAAVSDDATIAEEARQAGGFDALLADIRAIDEKLKEQNRALVDSILRADGWKIVVDMSACGRLASQFTFDPNRVVVVDPDRRIFQSSFRASEEKSYVASFNKPVLADEAALRYCGSANSGEIPILTLDGKPLSLDWTGRFEVKKRAIITADKISITIEAGARISIENRSLVVRPAPPARKAAAQPSRSSMYWM